MDNKNTIYLKLVEITKDLINEDQVPSDTERLVLIGSNSVRMVAFITSIEEEWGIQLNDSLINAQFFTDFDYLIDCIEKSFNSLSHIVPDKNKSYPKD